MRGRGRRMQCNAMRRKAQRNAGGIEDVLTTDQHKQGNLEAKGCCRAKETTGEERNGWSADNLGAQMQEPA